MVSQSRLLDEATFPIAELTAAALDGELTDLNGAFHSIAEFADCELRAETLKLAPRIIAERMTAAWVYGAISSLRTPLEICMDISNRTRPPAGSEFHTREVVIASSEWILIGMTQVTTPIRTILDLVCTESVSDSDSPAELAEIIGRLAAFGKLSREYCVEALGARFRVPDRTIRTQFIDSALADTAL